MTNFKTSGKLKAVTFSYDDGVVQDIRLIELLNKYNLKCTFNLNSGLLGKAGTLLREEKRICHYKIQPQDVKKIYEGHEISAHTLTHPLLPTLEAKEIIRQVEEDRNALGELAGYEVVGMAYPGGGVNNDDRVAEIIKANTGIKYARTTSSNEDFEKQTNLLRFNPTLYHLNFQKLMELGEKFINLKAEKPQIFYIWGHSYEMDYDNLNWAKLEDFFKLISGKDDIFYGTNKAILL